MAIGAATLTYFVAVGGLQLRRWTWEATQEDGVRFVGDMQRNVRYGTQAMREGYLNVYEKVYAANPTGDYDIDYPPLRLLTFDLWMRATARNGEDTGDWQPSYEFNRPVLEFNTFTEAMSAIAALLLVRRWTKPIAGEVPQWRLQLDSWGRAAFAGLLIWFSPAALADGHVWASYDVWIPPFFLWSLYLASCRWWTAAGIVLGIGAMFKGQMLLVAPLFLLWPVMASELMAAVRFACGFAIAAAAVAAPFICSNLAADQSGRELHVTTIFWIAGVSFAALLPTLFRVMSWRPKTTRAWIVLCVAMYAVSGWLVVWPAVQPGHSGAGLMLISGAAVLLSIASFIQPKKTILLMLSTAAVAVFASMALFDNSPAWWNVGFRYGAERFFHLVQGPNANLPAMLVHSHFGWNALTDIAWTIHPHLLWRWPAAAIDVPIRQFLLILYFIGLLLCCIAAAVHWRRKDRRFLVAASTVWILFYSLLPQMIGRYLLFGGTIAAIATAESIGLGLISLLLSLVSAICTMQLITGAYNGSFVSSDDDPIRQLTAIASRTTPGIGWAVLLAGAIFLVVALNFRRRTPDQGFEDAGRVVASEP